MTTSRNNIIDIARGIGILLVVYIILAISALVERQILLRKLLSYIGSSSLFILIFHAAIQNVAFERLSRISKFEYFNGIGSFMVAVLVPIVILEITKRQALLRAILLPRKSSRS